MKKLKVRDLCKCRSQIVLLLLIGIIILCTPQMVNIKQVFFYFQHHLDSKEDSKGNFNFLSQSRLTSGLGSGGFNNHFGDNFDEDFLALHKQEIRLNKNRLNTTRPRENTLKKLALTPTLTVPHQKLTYPESNSAPYFFLVLVLCHPNQFLQRRISRKTWNNETYFRAQGVSLKILYLLGRDAEESPGNFTGQRIERDMIITDVFEHRDNLTLKVMEGLKIAQKHFTFEYVLKTDIDVFNNYTQWQKKILETALKTRLPVFYGGGLCVHHPRVPFKYCSGLGYVLHHSLVNSIVEYPREKISLSEDMNTGKVLWERNVTFQFGGSAKQSVSPNECWKNPLRFTDKRSGESGYRLAAHAGTYMGIMMMKRCWYRMQCGCNEVPWDWDPP